MHLISDRAPSVTWRAKRVYLVDAIFFIPLPEQLIRSILSSSRYYVPPPPFIPLIAFPLVTPAASAPSSLPLSRPSTSLLSSRSLLSPFFFALPFLQSFRLFWKKCIQVSFYKLKTPNCEAMYTLCSTIRQLLLDFPPFRTLTISTHPPQIGVPLLFIPSACTSANFGAFISPGL